MNRTATPEPTVAHLAETEPFFATPESQEALLAAAGRWIGTPFHAHAKLRGIGVDCIHLAAELMRETGHLPFYEFPSYEIDAGHHLERSMIEDWLGHHPGYQRFNPKAENAMIGDLFCYRLRVAHHIAVCIGWPHGIHVLAGRRVVQMNLDDATFVGRFSSAFRPVLW